MKKKISVIIPSYKPQEYLWECLNSIMAQTFPKEDFEVILVLNGCTEPYKSDIERYIAKEALGLNVIFIHTEKGGVSNARNLALGYVRGEFVTFIDDDDLVSPSYLQELYNNADSDTIVLCYPYSYDDGYLEKQLPYHITEVYELCSRKKKNKISSKVRKYFSGPCMKLIPMNFIQGRRFDCRFKNGEDTLFMFLISDCIKDIRFTSKEAIYYRRNRKDSAANRKRSFKDIVYSNLLQIWTYIKYYLKSPFNYNLLFFTSRVCGALYAILLGLLTSKSK